MNNGANGDCTPLTYSLTYLDGTALNSIYTHSNTTNDFILQTNDIGEEGVFDLRNKATLDIGGKFVT